MLHQYKLTLLPLLQLGKYGQGPKSVYFFFISIVSTPELFGSEDGYEDGGECKVE